MKIQDPPNCVGKRIQFHNPQVHPENPDLRKRAFCFGCCSGLFSQTLRPFVLLIPSDTCSANDVENNFVHIVSLTRKCSRQCNAIVFTDECAPCVNGAEIRFLQLSRTSTHVWSLIACSSQVNLLQKEAGRQEEGLIRGVMGSDRLTTTDLWFLNELSWCCLYSDSEEETP